jgi:hypothetical protein
MAVCQKPYINQSGIACPCGQCRGCLTNRKQLWTHRILLESLDHEKNSFITLTYASEYMPKNDDGIPTLKKRDLSLFFRRLRAKFDEKFRYYAVGEYGTSGERGINPHFHAIIFGYGQECSESVADAWRTETGSKSGKKGDSLGHTLVGSLTTQSAAYVAGYVQKKTSYAKDMYDELGITPEYATMSKGIGKGAVDKIAAVLEQYPEGLTENGDVPFSLNVGNRQYPLGSFLREKLREKLGLDCTIETLYDGTTGEIKRERKIWHAKEKDKALREAEMQALRKNPEANAQAGPLPQDAQISLAHYLRWKDGQSILNFNRRQDLHKPTKPL